MAQFEIQGYQSAPACADERISEQFRTSGDISQISACSHRAASQAQTGVVPKAEALADLKSGNNKLESITLGDMKVRVFGDTAVVTGTDDEKSSYKGKDTSGHYTWADVFVKSQGRWQAAASQGTLMAKQ